MVDAMDDAMVDPIRLIQWLMQVVVAMIEAIVDSNG